MGDFTIRVKLLNRFDGHKLPQRRIRVWLFLVLPSLMFTLMSREGTLPGVPILDDEDGLSLAKLLQCCICHRSGVLYALYVLLSYCYLVVEWFVALNE